MRIKQTAAIISLFTVFLMSASPALAATLSLDPATSTFGRPCTFSVDVLLDTQTAETDGTDAILLYNPQLLSANSITNGTIYTDFPGNTIDNGTGKVSIYALAPTDKGFTGKGTLATVEFSVSASASASLATVRVDFDQNNITKTTDSNVIRRSDLKDVLSSVSNGSYTIDPNSTGCKTTTTLSSIGGGDLPQSGIGEITTIVGGLGILMTIIGALGLVKFRAKGNEVN